jgi:hypothetical protein
MGILPDNLFGPEGFGSGGLLGGLPAWLFNAQQFGLPPGWANVPSAAQPTAGQTPVQPPSESPMPAPSNPSSGIGDILANIRAGIPQGLADNSNTLLAFGGGSLGGGIGKGLTDASKIGLHEADLAQKRKALAAQHTATIQALRGAGFPNAEAIAAMNPALAKLLLAHASPKSNS